MVCQKISLHAQICQPLPLHSLIFGYPNLFHYFLNGITNGTSVLHMYLKWYLSFVSCTISSTCTQYVFLFYFGYDLPVHPRIMYKYVSTNMYKYVHQQTWGKCAHVHINKTTQNMYTNKHEQNVHMYTSTQQQFITTHEHQPVPWFQITYLTNRCK